MYKISQPLFQRRSARTEQIGICANQIEDPSPRKTGYPAHSHDSYELFIPLTDSLDFEVADYSYTVKRSDLLLLPPT